MSCSVFFSPTFLGIKNLPGYKCQELSMSCVCALLDNIVLLTACSVEVCNLPKYSFHSSAIEGRDYKQLCSIQACKLVSFAIEIW